MEKSERLMSLDALRGADMFWIIGGSALLVAFCKLCGWGGDCWAALQMKHVAWHGFHQRDTIFPLFLFLAGASWPFSYASQCARGRSTWRILGKIAFRVAALCVLGLFGRKLFTADFANMRWDSVLAHIAWCWALAAVIYMFVKSWKARFAIMLALLVGHWLLLFCVRAPDAAELLASTDPAIMKKVAAYAKYGTDNFSFTGNLAGWIDRTFMPGVLSEGIFDADGLLAKLTGTVICLFGMASGALLRRSDLTGNRKTLLLIGAGVVCLALCFAWQPWCPVNKKIWTSTFVLAAGAYSFWSLALFYWLVDVKGYRRWTFFFRVIGMNSITIYIMMRFVNFRSIGEYFLCGVASLGGAAWSALVLSFGQIAVAWIVLWYLYRNRTFLRV